MLWIFIFGLDSVVLVEGNIVDPCNEMSDKFRYSHGQGPLSSRGEVRSRLSTPLHRKKIS